MPEEHDPHDPANEETDEGFDDLVDDDDRFYIFLNHWPALIRAQQYTPVFATDDYQLAEYVVEHLERTFRLLKRRDKSTQTPPSKEDYWWIVPTGDLTPPQVKACDEFLAECAEYEAEGIEEEEGDTMLYAYQEAQRFVRWFQDHYEWVDRDQQEEGDGLSDSSDPMPPPTADEPGPDATSTKDYSPSPGGESGTLYPSELTAMADVCPDTLNKYAKMAGVPIPERGKKNHRYSVREARTILQMIADRSPTKANREACKKALEDHPKIRL